ncbi:MAG: hypothetical protein PHT88_05475 [Candidatus Moranbacteria bacterium]|nr:hypothetical protein [Candidatus Moranbacteria bacterium]
MIERFTKRGEISDEKHLRNEVRKLTLHYLTSFPVRGMWHAYLDKELWMTRTTLMDIERPKADQINFLRAVASRGQSDTFVILFGDMALLTFANAIDHDYGDNLFHVVAKHLRESLGEFTWGSYGGDEFVAFGSADSVERVRESIDTFDVNLGNEDVSKLIPNFTENGIKPRFNIGIATFSEACLLTADILEQDLNVQEKDVYRLFVSTYISLADMRSGIQKALGHIRLVMDLLESDRERYRRLKPFILKGCIGISSVLLWKLILIRKCCARQAFEKILLTHVLAIMRKRAKSPRDRLVTKAALVPWQQ